MLSLKVTPQITPDNRVILDLTVNKDSVGQLVASATGGFVPSIDTREITTQVLVNDGQTVVLGGILETERRDTENKVPYLGDIPVLGVLFRSKQKHRQQGRAADLRHAEDPARGRRDLLTSRASDGTMSGRSDCGRFSFRPC